MDFIDEERRASVLHELISRDTREWLLKYRLSALT
jgi:hypothetical protein